MTKLMLSVIENRKTGERFLVPAAELEMRATVAPVPYSEAARLAYRSS